MDHDLRFNSAPIATTIEANLVAKSKSDFAKSQPCQICSKKGHGAVNCFNRLNVTRFPPTHNRKLTAGSLPSPIPPAANLAESQGAMSMWYPDTGATTHIAASGKLIQSSTPYQGNSVVITANGESMPIIKSGKSMAKLNQSQLVLDKMLLVPTASKNLLSVQQLCADNKVYLQFDEQRVRVREAGTGKLIAEGREADGLYQLPLFINKNPEALAVTRATGDRWHERLGHLNSRAIKQLAARNLISLTCKNVSQCESCLVAKSHALPHKPT